jgi:magnesium-transporting ATPase (P-type)
MSFPNDDDLIKPWSWNIFIEGVMWFVVILLIVGIVTWVTAGKDRKNLPDVLGRNIEDFAGVAQEGNGPIPLFLLLFYLVVALFMIGYPAVTMIFNYKY